MSRPSSRRWVAPDLPGLAIPIEAGGRKDPWPDPLSTGVRVLAGERVRELDPPCAGLEVMLVLLADRGEVTHQVHLDDAREDRATDDDLVFVAREHDGQPL